jgi:hydrogenase maturation protease
MSGRLLIAGVGNIFLGDDGFGVEVAARLASAQLPGWAHVVDYGIRGMHLAYDLANGYQSMILIDATARGSEPGTIYVIEPDLQPLTGDAAVDGNPLFNAQARDRRRLRAGQPRSRHRTERARGRRGRRGGPRGA